MFQIDLSLLAAFSLSSSTTPEPAPQTFQSITKNFDFEEGKRKKNTNMIPCSTVQTHSSMMTDDLTRSTTTSSSLSSSSAGRVLHSPLQQLRRSGPIDGSKHLHHPSNSPSIIRRTTEKKTNTGGKHKNKSKKKGQSLFQSKKPSSLSSSPTKNHRHPLLEEVANTRAYPSKPRERKSKHETNPSPPPSSLSSSMESLLKRIRRCSLRRKKNCIEIVSLLGLSNDIPYGFNDNNDNNTRSSNSCYSEEKEELKFWAACPPPSTTNTCPKMAVDNGGFSDLMIFVNNEHCVLEYTQDEFESFD